MANILITGGAGFIGKKLAKALRLARHDVTVFDNLHAQVHPDPEGTIAELKQSGVTFTQGNVLDGDALAMSIIAAKSDIIVHLAAETGTGQSYDLPAQYCEVNVTGTARLIEALRTARSKGGAVHRVLLAGSRAVYGEGACRDGNGHELTAVPRLVSDLTVGDFSPKDAKGRPVNPVPSRASTTVPAPASVYASTKLMQEYLLRQGLEQSGIEVGILRLQNVYGAGQSLHNPYTGVLSIFAQQLLDGKTLEIYEDGEIVRDFVYVSDVVTAFHRLCEIERVPIDTLDIGSGVGSTILEVARTMIAKLGLEGERLTISGQFRPGDIRYAVADIAAAQAALEWAPRIPLNEGIGALVEWAREAT
jgi:dTDP-L-rhamnose 4-epimerase